MLAANAQGFGAMWKTGAPAYDAQVKQALGSIPTMTSSGFMYIGTQVGGGSPAARPVGAGSGVRLAGVMAEGALFRTNRTKP